MSNLRDPQSGESLATYYRDVSRVKAWNAAALAHRTRNTRPGALARHVREFNAVGVINNLGSDIGRYGVVGIGSAVFGHGDNEAEFLTRPTVRAAAPAASGDFAIVQSPAVNGGGVVDGLVTGVTPVLIDVVSESDAWAGPIDGDHTRLRSGSGPARILYKESGTGDQWGWVQLSTPALPPRAVVLPRREMESNTPFDGQWHWLDDIGNPGRLRPTNTEAAMRISEGATNGFDVGAWYALNQGYSLIVQATFSFLVDWQSTGRGNSLTVEAAIHWTDGDATNDPWNYDPVWTTFVTYRPQEFSPGMGYPPNPVQRSSVTQTIRDLNHVADRKYKLGYRVVQATNNEADPALNAWVDATFLETTEISD